MKFNIILAVDNKNGIGKDNTLPWHFSEDLKYFCKLTKYTETMSGTNAVIMGRKTCESLPKRYLPGRLNIVMTKNADYINENVKVANKFSVAFDIAKNNNVDTIWVIGGA